MKQFMTSIIAVTVWYCIGLATAQSIVVLEETDDYRRIQHAGGETQVPLRPSRIAALTAVAADRLIALEHVPHAVTVRGDTPLPYLVPHLAGAVFVGDEVTPSLEAILAAEPDLIIASAGLHAGIYPQLSAIAPTVLLAEGGADNDITQTLMTIARIIGAETAAETWLEQYQSQVADLRQALLDAGVLEDSALFMRIMPRGPRLYGRDSLAGRILFDELGFTVIDTIPAGESWQELTLEGLPNLTAEHIFVWGGSAWGTGDIADVQETSLWQNLPAVQAEQIYYLSEDSWHWIQAPGALARLAILDDVARALRVRW